MNDSTLNDEAARFARRKHDAILVLASVTKLSGKLRKALWRFLGRPVETERPAPRDPFDKFRRQLKNKTGWQLIQLFGREWAEVAAERRRYALNLPKIIEGVLPSNLPALRFLEARKDVIEKEMKCRGMVV